VTVGRAPAPSGSVDVSAGFWIDALGEPAAPPLATPASADGPFTPEGRVVHEPPHAVDSQAVDGPAAVLDAEVLGQISLAPPPPLAVDARGFFARDELLLELVLVDRSSGTPRWKKVVHAKVDPTDAAAMRRTVHAAVTQGGWEPAADLAR
jgi:hypothetical protein